MKKIAWALGMGAMLTFTACSETFEPTVDFGEKTFVNDYAGLISALNDMNSSLNQKLAALNEMLDQKLASIKVSIDGTTGAITTQTTTLNSALGTLNTTMLNGFSALNEQQKKTGESIVTAINDKGDLLSLKLDAQNQILSATSQTLGELLVAVKDQTAKTDARLEALNTLLTSGLQNIKLSIDAQTGKIEAQTVANTTALQGVTTALGDVKDKLVAMDTNINGSLGDINSSLGDVNSSLGDVNTSVGGIGTALGTTNTSLGNIITELQNLNTAMGGVNTSIGAVSTAQGLTNQALSDINGSLLGIYTAVGTVGTKIDDQTTALGDLTASVEEVQLAISTKGDAIKLAIDNQGNLVKAQLVNVADKLDAVKEAVASISEPGETQKIFTKESDATTGGLYKAVYVLPEYWELAKTDASVKTAISDMLDLVDAPYEMVNRVECQDTREAVPTFPKNEVLGALSMTKLNVSSDYDTFASTETADFDGVTANRVIKLPKSITWLFKVDPTVPGIGDNYYIYKMSYADCNGLQVWNEPTGTYSNNVAVVTINNYTDDKEPYWGFNMFAAYTAAE